MSGLANPNKPLVNDLDPATQNSLLYLPGQSEPYLAVWAIKLFGLMPLHIRSCTTCKPVSPAALRRHHPYLACQLRPPPAS